MLDVAPKNSTTHCEFLSTFDEGPDLVLYYKYLMVLEGNAEYTCSINASDALSPSQREFTRIQWRLFKNWWHQWSGRESPGPQHS